MIQTFRCKKTQALFEGHCPRQWQGICKVAERKLAQLDAAVTLDFFACTAWKQVGSAKR